MKTSLLLPKWCSAVAGADLEKLLNLYDAEACLKPTLSNEVRLSIADIREYFIGGSKFKDSGFLKQGIIKVDFNCLSQFVNNNCYFEMGTYDFEKQNGEIVRAHFSFSYVVDGEKLKIKSHHSSSFI